MSQKRFFHDQLILLLMLIMALLTIFNVLSVFLRIDTQQSIATVRYQMEEQGAIPTFFDGSPTALYNFAAAAIVFTILNTIIALRIYDKKRAYAVVVFGLTIIVLLFNIVVSGAILNLQ